MAGVREKVRIAFLLTTYWQGATGGSASGIGSRPKGRSPVQNFLTLHDPNRKLANDLTIRLRPVLSA